MSQLTLTGVGPSGASGNGLLNGLVAYWKLDEAGGDVLDIHSSKTFTAIAAPDAEAGLVYATARSFYKASSQYAWRGADAALRGGTDFTFAVWFYLFSDPGASPNYYNLSENIYGNTGWTLGLVDNGAGAAMQIFMQAAHPGGYYTAHTVPVAATIDSWCLATCWYDHANKTIYVQRDDAAPVAQIGAAPMTPMNNLKAHGLAARVSDPSSLNPGDFFDGRLQSMCLWSRILLATERQALYNAGAGLPYAEFTY